MDTKVILQVTSAGHLLSAVNSQGIQHRAASE